MAGSLSSPAEVEKAPGNQSGAFFVTLIDFLQVVEPFVKPSDLIGAAQRVAEFLQAATLTSAIASIEGGLDGEDTPRLE